MQAGRFVDPAILIIIRSCKQQQQQQQQHRGGSCRLREKGRTKYFSPFPLSLTTSGSSSEPQRRQPQLVVVVTCRSIAAWGQVEVEREQELAGRRGGSVHAIIIHHRGRGAAVAMAVAVEDRRRRGPRREHRPRPRNAERFCCWPARLPPRRVAAGRQQWPRGGRTGSWLVVGGGGKGRGRS